MITLDLNTNDLICHQCGEIQRDYARTVAEFDASTAVFIKEHANCMDTAVKEKNQMLALSIKQPWTNEIAHGNKRIENRTWPPPPDVVGLRIALHATKTDDGLGYGAIKHITGTRPSSDLPRGAVVATAVVKGYITPRDVANGLVASDQRKWFTGPCGWVLVDVQPLPEPIPCRGYQKLWTVPADIAKEIAQVTDGATP